MEGTMASATAIAPRTDEYTDNVGFDALAKRDAAFARVYDANNRKLDFQDPETIKQLTKSLLRCDFGLDLELPDDRLCPPVPVRWNYVRWMQRLVDTTDKLGGHDDYDSTRVIRGLDIGTGASAIYSLLACASRPQWKMYATDVDAESLDHARRNISINNLSSRVHLRRSTSDSSLIPLDTLLSTETTARSPQLDFTICNPPFYTSEADLLSSSGAKDQTPSSVCTGSASEMITPGGDEAFITRMINESTHLGQRVTWYSSMCGKTATLHTVIRRLHDLDVTNFAIALLTPVPARTRRWGIAWSYGDVRPACEDVIRGPPPMGTKGLPWSTRSVITQRGSADALSAVIGRVLGRLDVRFVWDAHQRTGRGQAGGNVWSRAARRAAVRKSSPDPTESRRDGVVTDIGYVGHVGHARAREAAAPEAVGGGVDPATDGRAGVNADSIHADKPPSRDDQVKLAFRLTVDTDRVVVDWTRGHDRILFESFCGMIKRALRENIVC